MFKVIVVDDSNLAKKRVINLLNNVSDECEVVATANDGFEALEAYLTHRPNLVITDIEMPNMNGIELITKLKALNADLFIIAVTSMVNEKIKQLLMKNSDVYVLHKPIDRELFREVLIKLKNKS